MTPLNLEAQCQLATKTNIQRLYITDDANGVVFFFYFICVFSVCGCCVGLRPRSSRMGSDFVLIFFFLSVEFGEPHSGGSLYRSRCY